MEQRATQLEYRAIASPNQHPIGNPTHTNRQNRLTYGVARSRYTIFYAIPVPVPSMTLFDRMLMAARANVTDWLQQREDPEQQVTRILQEMQGKLVMQRQAVAQAIATQKRTERQAHQAQSLADEWYRRASIAMGKGDETLAREALARRQSHLNSAQQQHAAVQQQIALIAQLRRDLQILENRLIEIRSEKELLIARARSAQASLDLNEMLDQTGSSQSTRAFERLTDKVNQLEAQVEVNAELAANRLESRFAKLTEQQALEADLTALKQDLGNPTAALNADDPELAKIRAALQKP